MKVFKAITTGLGMLWRAKRYIFIAWLINFCLAIVLAAGISETLKKSIGSKQAGENMQMGFDGVWYNNFATNAEGLARTFNPGITGMGAVYSGLDTFITGAVGRIPATILFIGCAYLLVWVFLSGGFFGLFVQGSEKKKSFWEWAGENFLRFLTLGIMALFLYWLVLAFLLPWTTNFVNWITEDTLDERVHFTWVVIQYLLLWSIVLLVNLTFDYSKVLMVRENKRLVFMLPVRALRIIFKNFRKTGGTYVLVGVIWLFVLLIYKAIVPGIAQANWTTIALAFLVGQAFILARIAVRAFMYATETAMCVGILDDIQSVEITGTPEPAALISPDDESEPENEKE